MSKQLFLFRDQFESAWYKGFLSSDDIRSRLRSDPTHRDTKEFRGLFRVSFDIFEQLVQLYVVNDWYDSTRRDTRGVLCSDLELLILGSLFILGNGSSTRWILQNGTNIDKEVHRLFFRSFVANISSIKSHYISMPSTVEELRFVEKSYAELGLIGCCGSIDIVHVGWDACPKHLIHVYKGKESYPSIASI